MIHFHNIDPKRIIITKSKILQQKPYNLNKLSEDKISQSAYTNKSTAKRNKWFVNGLHADILSRQRQTMHYVPAGIITPYTQSLTPIITTKIMTSCWCLQSERKYI